MISLSQLHCCYLIAIVKVAQSFEKLMLGSNNEELIVGDGLFNGFFHSQKKEASNNNFKQ